MLHYLEYSKIYTVVPERHFFHLQVNVVRATNTEHQVLLFLGEQLSWCILHYGACVKRAEDTFFLELRLVYEIGVLQALDYELNSNLLFWISKLIEKEGWFETKGLPTVAGETIDLTLCVCNDNVIV